MTDEARAADSPPRPTVHIPNPVYLYVIFDGPSGPESGRFVELEDEHGQGVGGATWEERGDGFWSLGPFLQPPVEAAEQPASDLGAMVDAILDRASLITTKGGIYHDWYVAVKDIHETAQRLKVALAQREGMQTPTSPRPTHIMTSVVAASSSPSTRRRAMDKCRWCGHVHLEPSSDYNEECGVRIYSKFGTGSIAYNCPCPTRRQRGEQ